MLATYKTTVQRKLISGQCLLLIKSLYLNFIIFPQYPFFLFHNPIQDPYHISLLCLFVMVPHSFPVFHDFDTSDEY